MSSLTDNLFVNNVFRAKKKLQKSSPSTNQTANNQIVSQNTHDIKVGVYTICKNESQFVDRWLNSMWDNGNGADYICVLDTGSEDNTYELLRECGKKMGIPDDRLIVGQQVFTPWRFDTSRNASMELIPKGKCDVIISTDIDEILIHDFWEDLRNCVREHPNFHRIFYQYAWSHDQTTNEPKWYFWYDKITKPEGWYWKFPVHEALFQKDGYNYQGDYWLDANKIYLHHYPDPNKSRGSYLGLLELRAKEYPDDLYGIYYLSREYSFRSDYTNAIKWMTYLYAKLKDGCTDLEAIQKIDDMGMLPCVCNCLGVYYNHIGCKQEAEYWFKRGFDFDATHRELYINYAMMLAYMGRCDDCDEVLKNMTEKSRYVADWRNHTFFWRNWKLNHIKAVNECWRGDYAMAEKYFVLALADINTDDDKQDAYNDGLYGDIKWLEDKVGYEINIDLSNSV